MHDSVFVKHEMAGLMSASEEFHLVTGSAATAILFDWQSSSPAIRVEVLAQKAFALRTKPKLDNPDHAVESYQRWADAARP